MKKFKGFTEDQTRRIATKLGHTGSLATFGDFLNTNEKARAQFGKMLQTVVKGPRASMATGGSVPSRDKVMARRERAREYGIPLKDDKRLQRMVDKRENAGFKVAGSGQEKGNSTQEGTFLGHPIVDKSVNKQVEKTMKNPRKEGKDFAKPNVALDKVRPKHLIDEDLGKVDPTGTGVDEIALPNEVTGSGQDAVQVEAETVGDRADQIADELKAAEGLPSEMATVRGQLESLYEDFDGGETPAWAAGAMRNAEARMASRGLGASSMAGAAVAQAMQESALPIAQADAQMYGSFEMQNLRNRQEVVMAGFEVQAQALFTDQAATNAARQFNAQSQNEMEQFFSGLRANVDVARANITNDVNKFNSAMQDQRERFNSTNALAIASANAAWRQRVTTNNTAAKNAANILAAQTYANMHSQAFDAYVQLERDEMAYLNEALNRGFVAGENARDRMTDILLAEMTRDLSRELQDDSQQYETGKAIGEFIFDVATSEPVAEFLGKWLRGGG